MDKEKKKSKNFIAWCILFLLVGIAIGSSANFDEDSSILNANHGDLLRYNVSSYKWENYFFPLTMHNVTDGVNLVVHSGADAENSSYYPLNSRGDNEIVLENSYGKLSIYPEISRNIITQIQYCNLTSYMNDVELDLTFRFDEQILNPDIWIWKNISHNVSVDDYGYILDSYIISNIESWEILDYTPEFLDYGDKPSDFYVCGIVSNSTEYIIGFDSFEWINDNHTIAEFFYEYYAITGNHIEYEYFFDWYSIKDKFNHQEYGGKHYYYIRNFVLKNKLYNFKWCYDITLGSSGKWDLLVKKSSDSLGEWRVIIDPYWNSDYKAYRKITIESDFIDDDLINFPLLVVLDNSTGDFNFHNNGADIEFISTNNITQFNHEIEKFDNAGETICWVNISEVLTSASDYSFLVYYDNSADVTVAHNPTDVWDSNYLAVWHMNNQYDSTSNDIDLTVQGADSGATGKIGDAYNFVDGNTDWLQHSTFLDEGWSASTWESWSSRDNTNTIQYWISKTNLGGQDRANVVNLNDANGNIMGGTWEGSNTGAKSPAGVTAINVDEQFYYQAVTYGANTELKSWVDDNFEGLSAGTIGTMRAGGAVNFEIGRSGVMYWDGKIDEVRISDIRRNGSWLNASFHSGNMSVGFMGFGVEMSEPIVIIPGIDFLMEFDFVKEWLKFNFNFTVDGNVSISGRLNISDQIILNGSARVRKEVTFKSQTSSKGASSPTDALRAIGISGDILMPVVQFSKVTQQDLHGEFHLPWDIDNTVNLEFHLMWIPGDSWSSGNYVWKLEYLVKEEYDNMSTGVPTTISMDVTPLNAFDMIETKFTSTIDADAEQIIFAHFYRDIASDNADDIGEVVFFEVNYISNKLGESI